MLWATNWLSQKPPKFKRFAKTIRRLNTLDSTQLACLNGPLLFVYDIRSETSSPNYVNELILKK